MLTRVLCVVFGDSRRGTDDLLFLGANDIQVAIPLARAARAQGPMGRG